MSLKKGQIAIPKQLRVAAGVLPGTEVTFAIKAGKIVISKLTSGIKSDRREQLRAAVAKVRQSMNPAFRQMRAADLMVSCVPPQPAREPSAQLTYHSARSTLERTRLVMPENDLDYELLRQITDQPTASQRGLAARLGVSLGKVNYCLRALVDKGWVKANNFRRSDNKLAYAYLLTPRGASAKLQLAHDFLARKEREFDRLQSEITELRSVIADSRHTA